MRRLERVLVEAISEIAAAVKDLITGRTVVQYMQVRLGIERCKIEERVLVCKPFQNLRWSDQMGTV